MPHPSRRTLCWLLLLGSLLAGPLSAQTIRHIIVNSASPDPVNRQLLLANTRLREGEPFAPDQLSADIHRLYESGHFFDVVARVDPVDARQVDLVYTVRLTPRLHEVRLAGNKRKSTKRLLREVTLEAGDILRERQVSSDLDRLYTYYRKNGYHDVVIRPRLEEVDDPVGYVTLVYEIDERFRAKTRGVEISGNASLSDHQVRKVMETEPSIWGYIFPTGYFQEDELRDDLGRIRDLYENRGYLDATVLSYEKRYNQKNSKVYLDLQLDEGDPYDVASVEITGNEVFSEEELRQYVWLRPDRRFSAETEKGDVKRLTDHYNRHGYLDCVVLPRRVSLALDHSVKVTYQVIEGQKARIRDVHISGNSITHDKVIRRELSIHPGDLGDRTKIEASQKALGRLGYFQTVDIVDLDTPEPGYRDLLVKVTERDTGRLLMAAGFSSADDVVGSVELAQTNFDLKGWPTFRGAGERFRIRAMAGSTSEDYRISYTEPWLFERRLRLDYDIWMSSVSSNRGWEQDTLGTSAMITRPMIWFPSWRQSFGYTIQNIEIEDIDESFSQEFRDFETASSQVSNLHLVFTKDRRDNFGFPTRGYRVRLRTDFGAEDIGNYTDYYRLTLDGEQYFPVLRGSVIKLRARLGTLDRFGGDEEIHVFDRFFAGGMRSVRGFKERRIGPADPGNDEAVGGQSVGHATVEYIHPLLEETIYGALWTDAGEVWADPYEWEFDKVDVGSGFGFRFRLPMVSVQLDYGWPILKQEDHLSNRGRLHFSLGYTF